MGKNPRTPQRRPVDSGTAADLRSLYAEYARWMEQFDRAVYPEDIDIATAGLRGVNAAIRRIRGCEGEGRERHGFNRAE